MPTKAMSLPKGEVTEADVVAALRALDERVAVIKRELAESDKESERLRKSSHAKLTRTEKLLAR